MTVTDDVLCLETVPLSSITGHLVRGFEAGVPLFNRNSSFRPFSLLSPSPLPLPFPSSFPRFYKPPCSTAFTFLKFCHFAVLHFPLPGTHLHPRFSMFYDVIVYVVCAANMCLYHYIYVEGWRSQGNRRSCSSPSTELGP